LYYSDGISEAEQDSGEQFGTGRLAEVIENNHQQRAEQLIETIKDNVLKFTCTDYFNDDFTCIVIKIE